MKILYAFNLICCVVIFVIAVIDNNQLAYAGWLIAGLWCTSSYVEKYL